MNSMASEIMQVIFALPYLIIKVNTFETFITICKFDFFFRCLRSN
jgi:hypothetical protein